MRSRGEFGHLGFESKGVKETQVRFLFSTSLNNKVTEKAKKRPKMARFWPKLRCNGRAMAREVFLAVQDSSIGDIVTQSQSLSVIF